MENRDTNAAAGNYFRFRCIFPPWDSMYAYFDINEHPESLRIFRQRGIRAKVVKTMTKKDVPYMIIVCRVPKRQSEAFSRAMGNSNAACCSKGIRTTMSSAPGRRRLTLSMYHGEGNMEYIF